MSGRLRPWHVVVPVTAVLVALDLLSAFVSHQGGHPGIWGFVTAFAGIAFVGAGLVAWSRRPGNAMGKLLVLGGLSWLAFAPLWTSNDSLLYTSGNAFGTIPIAILLLIVALYPEGRPTNPLERALALVLFPVAILSGLLPTFFEGEFSFGCTGCPSNRFLIADNKQVYDVLQAAFALVGIVFFLGVVVLAVLRWRRATPAMRRVLKPVYLTGGVSVAAIGIGFAVGFASTTIGEILWIVALVGVVLLPFALLAGLLQTSLMLGVRRLLDYADDPTSEGAQDAIRKALGDPTARLGLWIEQEQGYVDLRGNSFPLVTDGPDRAFARIDSANGPLGFIEHDAAVDVHAPELLSEVVTACRFALEKDRGRQALERSQTRMRALLDAMPDLMIRFRRDGTYVDIRGDVKGLVRPREEMIGRNVREFLPSPVVDELMDCAAAALATRTTQTSEYELELDGERRVFEARMVPSADDEIVSIVREVTLARRLERELTDRFAEIQHEQMFTRTVVNTAPIVLMLCDDEGGIIRFNDTTERLTGRPDDERVWGRPFWEVFAHPEDRHAVEEAFRRVAPGRELEEIECRWLTTGGDELIVACTFNHIVDGQGQTRRILAGLDVTERERSRREIRASRARLVEAQDAERRRLERNLHDGAQQRLVSLSLALRLAQAKLSADPEGAGDILTAAGDELALALAELRELARGIHPAMLTDRGLGAAVESLATRAPLPVELAAMPDERLPAPVEAAAFYVISEALANIGKYAHATAARVSVTRVDGHAVVEVDDDGVGGADPGSGSGLSGLLDRIEALDGSLAVVSPEGGGTRIRAEIPCPR